VLRIILILGFCFLTSALKAQTRNSAYLSLSDGSIVLADFDNCTVEELISPGNIVLFDIAEGPTERSLYGIYQQSLFLIDLDASTITELGEFTSSSAGLTNFNSLVKDADGSLLTVSEDRNGSLLRIDPNTLEATFLGATNYASGGDLTFIDGDLYLSAVGDDLVKINISNPGASQLIGNMNASGFSTIYGVVSVVSGEPCTGNIDYTMIATGGGSVRSVDTATGTTSPLCPDLLNGRSIFGAAEVTVASICRMTLSLQPVGPVCAGENFTVSAQIDPEIPFGEYTYEWYDADDTVLLSTEPVFSGSLNETTNLRCVVTDTDRVGEFKSVEASLTVEVDQAPLLNEIADSRVVEAFRFPQITGQNLPEPLRFYTQPFGQGNSFNPGDEIYYSEFDVYPITFYVYAENDLMCADEISFLVTIFPEGTEIPDDDVLEPPFQDGIPFLIPTYFTPNSDGYHDLWELKIAEGIEVTGVYIFDRFGKLLKQLDAVNPLWDGTYRGKNMPGTDYWYLISYRQEEKELELKGHFTLKR